MNKEEYLTIRDNLSMDTLPAIYFYYKLKRGFLDKRQFMSAFSNYLFLFPSYLPVINYFVFNELDKYFLVKEAN